MPYIIKKTKEKGTTGYKVCKLDNPKRCFSKHPLTEIQAQKQRTAIVLSELRRSRKVGGVRRRQSDPDYTPTDDTGTGNTPNTPNTPTNAQIQVLNAPPPLRRGTQRTLPDEQVTDRGERAARRAIQREGVLAAATIPIPGRPAPVPAAVPAPVPVPVIPPEPTRTRRNLNVINLAVPQSPERERNTAEIVETGTADFTSSSGTITKQQCLAFFDNPKKNPMSNSNIKRNGPTFKKLLLECYGVIDHDDYLEKIEKLKISKIVQTELFDILRDRGILKKELIAQRELNEDTCKELFEQPLIDPTSRRRITIDNFMKYSKKCKNILPTDVYNEHADAYVKNQIPDGHMGANKCVNLLNHLQISGIDGDDYVSGDYIIIDYFKNNSKIPITHPIVKRLLKRCSDDFLMKILLLQTLVGKPSGIDLMRYILNMNDTNKAYISIDYIGGRIADIASYIFNFNDNEEEKTKLLSNLLRIVTDILEAATSNVDEANFDNDKNPKKIFMTQVAINNLTACMYELQALKHGVEIKLSEESSSDRSSKRSKSLSVKEESLPLLPKKTRKEILDELGKACRDMRDNISFDDFEDMKKKKLQLVVKIGPKNDEGKQSCYYVKNIYQYVEKELANNKMPTDPYTRVAITRDDMKNVIIPKMKYIEIDVVNPFDKKEGQKVPNIRLVSTEVIDENGRHYYRVGFRRLIGTLYQDNTYEILGYIPTNIYMNEQDRGGIPEHYSDTYTGETDTSSSVIMAKLSMLVDKGMLTDKYGLPRVHINKSTQYWYTDTVKKAKKMIDEFDTYL